MTTKHPIIENTPAEAGGNLAPTEKSVGSQGRQLREAYGSFGLRLGRGGLVFGGERLGERASQRQTKRHDKLTGEIHQTIIQFGRLLQTGRDMYPSPKEFGWWVDRHNLNTGRLAHHQTERTACISIARLYDVGADVYAADGTRPTLTLTDCRMTTPTDVMKWARKTQPHLFPQIAGKERKHAPVAVETDNASKQELARELAKTQSELKSAESFIMSEVRMTEPDEMAALRAENERLWRENAELRSRLKPLDLTNADEVFKAIGASNAKNLANSLLARIKQSSGSPEDVF